MGRDLIHDYYPLPLWTTGNTERMDKPAPAREAAFNAIESFAECRFDLRELQRASERHIVSLNAVQNGCMLSISRTSHSE